MGEKDSRWKQVNNYNYYRDQCRYLYVFPEYVNGLVSLIGAMTLVGATLQAARELEARGRVGPGAAVVLGVVAASSAGVVVYEGMRYEEQNQFGWLVFVPVALLLTYEGRLAVLEMEARSQGGPSPRRRKIRHLDVWLPQLAMALVEATLCVLDLVVAVVTLRAVLGYFQIFNSGHQKNFEDQPLGKLLSYPQDIIEQWAMS